MTRPGLQGVESVGILLPSRAMATDENRPARRLRAEGIDGKRVRALLGSSPRLPSLGLNRHPVFSLIVAGVSGPVRERMSGSRWTAPESGSKPGGTGGFAAPEAFLLHPEYRIYCSAAQGINIISDLQALQFSQHAESSVLCLHPNTHPRRGAGRAPPSMSASAGISKGSASTIS